MNRILLSVATTTLGASLLMGCSSENEYSPDAKPTQLAAYAASTAYPANAKPQEAMRLAALVDPQSGQITLHNFSSDVIKDFNVWVNQAYVLHVDRIDPQSSRTINKTDLFNSQGITMDSLSPTDIKKVQIQGRDGILWNVQGPQMQ